MDFRQRSNRGSTAAHRCNCGFRQKMANKRTDVDRTYSQNGSGRGRRSLDLANVSGLCALCTARLSPQCPPEYGSPLNITSLPHATPCSRFQWAHRWLPACTSYGKRLRVHGFLDYRGVGYTMITHVLAEPNHVSSPCVWPGTQFHKISKSINILHPTVTGKHAPSKIFRVACGKCAHAAVETAQR